MSLDAKTLVQLEYFFVKKRESLVLYNTDLDEFWLLSHKGTPERGAFMLQRNKNDYIYTTSEFQLFCKTFFAESLELMPVAVL